MQSKPENKFHSECNAAMQRGDEESNKKRAGKEHDRPKKKQTTLNWQLSDAHSTILTGPIRSMRDKGQNNNYYFRRIKHMSTLLWEKG